MARPAREPRYWESRQGYFTHLNGAQILLASGPKEDPEVKRKAWEAFYRLRLEQISPGKVVNPSLDALLHAYLAAAKDFLAPSTLKGRRHYLLDLCSFLPGVFFQELSSLLLDQWVAARRKKDDDGRWGEGAERTALVAAVTALNWCVKARLVPHNPFSGVSRPAMPSRGRECLVSEAQHRLLLTYARRRRRPDFTDLLLFLHGTGCRPGEATALAAKDVVPSQKAVIFEALGEKRKGANKRRRHGLRRTLLLDDALYEMIGCKAKERPTGPLFLTERNTPWIDQTLSTHFAHIRCVLHRENKQGLSPLDGVTPYSYRHAYATDWLLSGRSAAKLAEVLGTSLAMIERHYGHLDAHHAELRVEVADFSRSRAASLGDRASSS